MALINPNGRALTKKNQSSAIVFSGDEDEGVSSAGTSPVETTSPKAVSSVFSFAESCASRSPVDDWSSLEREINRTCFPPSPTVVYAPPMHRSVRAVRDYPTADLSKFAVNGSGRMSCAFCSKNGELRSVVESHILRHPVTRAVICPVLRKYVCEICHATGDNAHTKFYCPRNTSKKTAPTAVMLKTTRNNACGKRSQY